MLQPVVARQTVVWGGSGGAGAGTREADRGNGNVAPLPSVFAEDVFGGALWTDVTQGGNAKKNK